MLLANSEQIREADRIQIEEHNYPGIILMEEAGRKCTEFLLSTYPENRAFVLLAGPGNNGGDVLVIARHLYLNGRTFKLILSHDPSRYIGDAKINFDILAEMPIEYELWEDKKKMQVSLKTLNNPILVDGLLGTGLSKPLGGKIAEMISFFRKKKLNTVAIDLPSGLSADSGKIINDPIPAEYTLTFQLPKVCQFVYPAAEYCGKTEVFDIGLWPSVIEKLGIKRYLLEEEWLKVHYQKRAENSHKGSFGHVLLVGGSKAYAGAIALAGFAALKAGAGLVTVFAPESCRHACNQLAPELIFRASSREDTLVEEDASSLEDILKGKDALVIGPGMGQKEETAAFFKELLPKLRCPYILDADGLNLLTRFPKLFKCFSEDSVLTPHPGEMKRLLEMSGKEVSRKMLDERLEIAEGFVKLFGCNLVLKGAGTIIGCPDGHSFVNTNGNPGMATAGSGDILSGIIGALLSQSYEGRYAACMGVFLHGKAGDKAAEKLGQEGMLASDIARNLDFFT
ncbi:MAG: NAD(P)H-hydrate dehydratase [Bacteroidia bacterium]|nr:NAD(P)H-hydrate dehydratase [Bacteroidia bacterium]